MNKYIVYIFICISILSIGCGSARKVVDNVIAPKTNIDSLFNHPDSASIAGWSDSVRAALLAHYIDFETFSAKVKVDSRDSKGKNPDITAVVRIVKDSAIWISLTATFLNMEVYRIYVSPDSVILLDKREKIVQYRSMDYLQEVTLIPFDFYTLQDMLMGNPVFFDEQKAEFRRLDNYILGNSVDPYFKHLLTLSAENTQLLRSKLDDVDVYRNRTAFIQYDNYVQIDSSISFSTKRQISMAEKNKLEIDLEFKQYEFNKELSVNFNVPKNYTEK